MTAKLGPGPLGQNARSFVVEARKRGRGAAKLLFDQQDLFRFARTSYRAFNSHPVRPPATIFPELTDELKQCRLASGKPQIVYFLKTHDVSYLNSDENSNRETNTKTNTQTNTKTETN